MSTVHEYLGEKAVLGETVPVLSPNLFRADPILRRSAWRKFLRWVGVAGR